MHIWSLYTHASCVGILTFAVWKSCRILCIIKGAWLAPPALVIVINLKLQSGTYVVHTCQSLRLFLEGSQQFWRVPVTQWQDDGIPADFSSPAETTGKVPVASADELKSASMPSSWHWVTSTLQNSWLHSRKNRRVWYVCSTYVTWSLWFLSNIAGGASHRLYGRQWRMSKANVKWYTKFCTFSYKINIPTHCVLQHQIFVRLNNFWIYNKKFMVKILW